ncbi:ATP-grasp fold amidoligase family protein [Methylorubrum sp. SB2]|uniref:ATP-grasp fold amidoligase family protein n=1 Tax=Methylorubrum subtropicum TaxID=3138812 RepID=UPI00313E1F00
MHAFSQKIKERLLSFLWTMAPERLKDWKRQIDAVRLRYRTRLNRELNLFRPVRFSEKMQWRKLFIESALFTQLSDKISVRHYIASRGLSSLLIPQLWIGEDPKDIPFDELPRPYIIKSSHGFGHTVIVAQDQIVDRNQVINKVRKWLAHCHGTVAREPGYLDVPRRIVIEPLLVSSTGQPPPELKVFVFDGTARYAQYVELGLDRNQLFGFVDRNWQRYSWRGRYNLSSLPEKPLCFDLALAAAEKLGAELDHCRVDFYLVDECVYIGEITLYSYSGMVTLQPDDTDLVMGSYWNIRWPRTRAWLAIATRRWGQPHRRM